MKITDLRALAAYHRQVAINDEIAAKGMGDCPTADAYRRHAAQHAGWADELWELAGAFEALGHVLAR